ncbi:PREDICTED: uncharacterized protein LOC109212652 [Nicotiana attenuata]|uniref:uncharacterized protein LOC109212652 n=1 Tax=Nicotiana attenuata TaxID=49451 RepID=UPI0009053CA2|nr:PREDICTED: uncharacterized protein LOC109212652 [Nicotiana attenuata]
MGHNVNEYELIPETVRPSILEKEAKEELLFIDGPGGTGKTFLYHALLATVRSKGYIALATATSGVAASILPGGRTAHSRFKIPIDLDENFSCNINKQSSTVGLIRDAKLIVWDEVYMAKKRMLDVIDLLLKDLMDTNILFGGKLLFLEVTLDKIFQLLETVKKEDFISESLLYSTIWDELEKLQLSEKMRAKTDPTFCDYLMRIGNGQERVNTNNKIELPDSMIIPFTTEEESLDHLFAVTFSNVHTCSSNPFFADSRVVLTMKNDFVNEINDILIAKFPEKATTFVSFDETVEPNDQSQFEDLIHSLNPASLPSYKLTLKENCPIILLRNLNPYEGLCNGTRLICCDIKKHVISAKIATELENFDDAKGTTVRIGKRNSEAKSEGSHDGPGYVLVIGVTNRPDAIDQAWRRPTVKSPWVFQMKMQREREEERVKLSFFY